MNDTILKSNHAPWLLCLLLSWFGSTACHSAQVDNASQPTLPNAEDEDSLYTIQFCSDLVVSGEIISEPREVPSNASASEGRLLYYSYKFRVFEVIKGKTPSTEVIEVVAYWTEGQGDPAFLKLGDKRILVLRRTHGSAWQIYSYLHDVMALNEERVATIKHYIAAGPRPPFNRLWMGKTPNGLNPSALDVRISTVTNAIAPVSKKLRNGQTLVLELPIRIENASSQTITANIAHEWYGGRWPPTDLGAAVRRDGEEFSWWQSQVFLSGEVGTRTERTVWEPGQSHEFVLRMNWPGTGSVRGTPLIVENERGDYWVRISLNFKAGEADEYVASPPFRIKVTEARN